MKSSGSRSRSRQPRAAIIDDSISPCSIRNCVSGERPNQRSAQREGPVPWPPEPTPTRCENPWGSSRFSARSVPLGGVRGRPQKNEVNRKSSSSAAVSRDSVPESCSLLRIGLRPKLTRRRGLRRPLPPDETQMDRRHERRRKRTREWLDVARGGSVHADGFELEPDEGFPVQP
jgi:hypothetical protein